MEGKPAEAVKSSQGISSSALQNITLVVDQSGAGCGDSGILHITQDLGKVKLEPETKKGKEPSLSAYFGSSNASDNIFDQIVPPQASNSAMMTSIRNPSSAQNLFKGMDNPAVTEVSSIESSTSKVLPADQPQSVEISSAIVKTSQDEVDRSASSAVPSVVYTKSDSKEEPVVCKIFSEISSDSSDSSKAFFDMISSGHSPFAPSSSVVSPVQSSLGVDLTQQQMGGSSCSSMVTSPDFTPDSYLTPSPSEDVFSKSVHLNESDRRRDAWIPSEQTRQALIAMATSPPGTYFPERDLLTMPGVVLEEEMVDTVHEVVSHYLGEAEASKRKVLTVNDVTQDDRGLRELIQAGCFRAAINLTGRLLTMYGQGAGRAGHPSKHTAHSIQLWFTRIALHVKLRSFSVAEVEAEPFGDLDRPDLYFQFYPELYGGRVGSMVPFSFRLVLAELPQYTMKHQEALNRLHALLGTVRKVVQNLEDGLCEDGSQIELSQIDRSESKKLWASRELRVLYSIANCALYQKDYTLAVKILEILIEKDAVHQRALESALGRLYLQLGDVSGAEVHFSAAREIRRAGCVAREPDIRELVDKGLIAVAQNAFQEGYEAFQKASLLDSANVMIINNMAVCLLYMGRLKEALKLLEEAVNSNPTLGLHESMLLNICTLYELESSYSNQKKLNMLKLLSQYKGDGIYVGCLKLQM